jgi:hypothetical protein
MTLSFAAILISWLAVDRSEQLMAFCVLTIEKMESVIAIEIPP